MICRGIRFELGDNSVVYVFINRFYMPGKLQEELVQEKIIGLAIENVNHEFYYFGYGMPLIYNYVKKYNNN